MKKSLLRNQRGQSVMEYMLVLMVVVGAILLVMSLLKKSNFFYKKVTEPLVKTITYNYKYGDPSAQGWDEGSPKLHIQISRPNEGQTFRLFQPKE
ncbi:MAG: hypothetical protein ACXVB9_18970 [Bdellovibrionota bacterium]